MAPLETFGLTFQLGDINHAYHKGVLIWFEGFKNGRLFGIEPNDNGAIDIQVFYFNIAYYGQRFVDFMEHARQTVRQINYNQF